MFAVYVFDTHKNKNILVGAFENLWDAVDCGANAPDAEYFIIKDTETGEFVDLDKM